jgi:N-acetyl-gamma-glutamyl-phosphate reductase
MAKVGIVGATGYSGIELLRILQQHPKVELSYCASESYAGMSIAEVYPHLHGKSQLIAEKLDLEQLAAKCDAVFCALPHGHATHFVPLLLKHRKKVIDLSADFRLRNSDNNSQQHSAVYGLAEAGWRDKIAQASLVANPGCYPTAAILAALPALKAKITDPNDCIFDAKSGVSGAGRSLSLHTHFCEASENLTAYKIAGEHQHTAEIEQELSHIAQQSVAIQFTPHLLPITRGLLMTAYFKLNNTQLSEADIYDIYQNFYQNESFIRMSPVQQLPSVKQVQGTNYCDIGLRLDKRTGRLIVIAVIDNLMKGAAGQAVQNMNLMLQFPETTGLQTLISHYP